MFFQRQGRLQLIEFDLGIQSLELHDHPRWPKMAEGGLEDHLTLV